MKKRPATWAQVKATLNTLDRTGLLGVIQNLYDASDTNRRFLHARFVPAASALEEYRRLVRAAVFPDPLSHRPIRLRDATATITEYKRATGDLAGTCDLMLEFVEAGTEQAADLGFGDDAYFAALERKVREVVQALDALAEADRDGVIARLVALGEYEEVIGWGYGDFLADVAATVQRRRTGSTKRQRAV
jgi:hypothetical protein